VTWQLLHHTVGEAVQFGVRILVESGGLERDEAALDVRHLMAAALGVSPDRVILALRDPITPAQEEEFMYLMYERNKRRSLAAVLGHRTFWGLRFVVSDAVLIPRPETETLVELALAEPFSDILDLGTGSACIAVTLLAERPEAVGVACDISEDALAVAAQNAEHHGVADRLHFEVSDWFESVGGTYDLIVSNPPYVSEADYAGLSPEVHHEPKIALTPGGDGLDAYRVIAREAPRHLTPGGRLLVEIGFDQGCAVSALFRTAGLEAVTVHPDINGKDRVVSARARAK